MSKSKGCYARVSAEEELQILELYDDGHTQRKIAIIMGRSKKTIADVLQGAGVQRPKGTGIKCHLSPEPEYARENSTITLRGFTSEAAIPYIELFSADRIRVLPWA